MTPAPTPRPLAYTLAGACEAAGIGRTELWLRVRRGEIPARKAGRKVLILAADLEAWLRSLPVAETPWAPQELMQPQRQRPGRQASGRRAG